MSTRIEYAKKACEVLKDQNWMDTKRLVFAVAPEYSHPIHTEVRNVLNQLHKNGLLDRRGTGKFLWKLMSSDFDTTNPFRTKLRSTEKKLKWIVSKVDSLLYIEGNTYETREALKTIGCDWDKILKKWWISADGENPAKLAIKATELGIELVFEGDKMPVALLKDEKPVSKTADSEDLTDLRREVKALRKQVETMEETRKTEITIKQNGKKDVKIKERVHPIFEQVMFHIDCGDNVMLVGPRGCGKTFLAEQVSNAMSLKFGLLSLSGGVTESKLFGRVTPNVSTGKNEYHSAQFVEMFEEGGLFLLDEVDAADPNVVLSLNSALANGVIAVDRTKKPTATRHKEFVCIAAANTWGNGANRQYVGRNQQDSAFTERFVQIAMDYDEALEKALCPGKEEFVEKLQAYRKRISDNRLERTISTRFILRAYNWLQNGKDEAYAESMLFAGWRDDEIKKVKGTY